MKLRSPVLFLMVFLAQPAGVLFAQYPNVRVSSEFDRWPDPEEVSIAINPLDTRQLAVGANITYLFTSSDGGYTWATSHMHSQYGFWGDPCLMFDDEGILYYEHLSGENWADPEFLHRIVVQRSTDAGISFDDGEQIGLAPPTQQDKSWLGLDRSSTNSRGTILTSWNEDDLYGSRNPQDSDRIFFSKSTDQGQSWSERVRVDDRGGDCIDSSNTVEGATTAVGRNGEIYIAWSGRDTIFFDRSTNGGRSFGKDTAIALQPHGWDLRIPGVFRGNGFPMLLSDLNPESKFYGSLYIMWSDERRGLTDIYFMSSANGGRNWSALKRVNTDSTLTYHFFPSMTLDPVTGHIFIVFYDRRGYRTNETDVYLAESVDGGASFTNERISESAFMPRDTVFFGDYINVTAYNRHVVPVWMRMDVGADSVQHMSVWTAIVTDSARDTSPTGGVFGRHLVGTTLSISNGEPPSIVFTLDKRAHLRLEAFDELGRTVAVLTDGEYGAGEYHVGCPPNLPRGSYLVRMSSISETNNASQSFETRVIKFVNTH